MTWSDRRIATLLAAAGAAVYSSRGSRSSPTTTTTDASRRQLLHGQWWLTEAPPWLNELVACGDERGAWCIRRCRRSSRCRSRLCSRRRWRRRSCRDPGGVLAGILYLRCARSARRAGVAITGAILSTFGTTLFFSSVDGRAWYAAHAVAMPFLSRCRSLRGARRARVAGRRVHRPRGASRAPVRGGRTRARAAAGAARRDAVRRERSAASFSVGVPFALVYIGYNLLRWGSLFDAGNVQLTQGDVFFTRGPVLAVLSAAPLYAIFLEPPDWWRERRSSCDRVRDRRLVPDDTGLPLVFAGCAR
jgi:hypothetical protein